MIFAITLISTVFLILVSFKTGFPRELGIGGGVFSTPQGTIFVGTNSPELIRNNLIFTAVFWFVIALVFSYAGYFLLKRKQN
jgi:hypothetical protein